MRRGQLFSLAVLFVVLAPPRADASNLVFSRGNDLYLLDPSTGAETFLATGSLDNPVNFSLEVSDAGIAYHGGTIGGQFAISATNLATGQTRDYILPGGFFGSMAGFYNGGLVIARDDSYFSLDLDSGNETSLAIGSLDATANYSLELLGDIAYHGGTIGGQHAVSATNLATGETRDYIAPGGFFNHFGGFYNGDLVLVRGTDFYALDLQDGSESFLGSSTLDFAVNLSWEIDGSLVYQGGQIGSQYAVSSVNLSTGATQDYILPGGFFNNFGGFYVPEPGVAGLLLASMALLGLRRRRDSGR